MGRLLNQLYKSEAWKNLGEASRSIRTLPNRLAREAALEELAQVKREMEEDVTSGINQLKDFGQPLDPAPRPATDQSQGTSSTSDPPKKDQPEGSELVSDQADAGQPKDGSSKSDQPGIEQPNDVASAPDQPDPPLEGSSPEEN
jgi:hypothetical protein